MLLGMGSYAICPRICSPNTLFTVCIVSRKRFPGESKIGQFGVMFHQKCDFFVKKGVPRTASKKGAPPKSNNTSRAHCTDKKQLFEQQMKHCSRFLHKKVDWAQNWCRKTDWIVESLQKLNGLLEIVDC